MSPFEFYSIFNYKHTFKRGLSFSNKVVLCFNKEKKFISQILKMLYAPWP